MKHIVIISSSVRKERLSHRIALFLQKQIESTGLATAEILDLKEYNFPLFDERLMYQDNPSEKVLDFTARFVQADGVFMVSPVYNASYPAALKNVIDLFVKEWKDKIVAVATVTYGSNAGITTALELQALLLKLGAMVVPPFYTALNAGTEYNEEGNPVEPEMATKFVKPVIEKLFYMINRLTV